jgi:dipeptidase D
MILEHLEPSLVWKIFEELFVPTYRSSGYEQEIAQKIIWWVENQPSLRISWKQDTIGNLLLTKPASSGCEAYPAILLQGHLDMVTETDRPGGFDFKTNSISVQITSDNEWVKADRTTLGADNGIGVSIALSLFSLKDEELSHGPLELLLTVSEETGLDGAFGLDIEKLPIKSRLMLNIDSEEIGFITIGSAGGGEIELRKQVKDNSTSEIIDMIKEPLIGYELTVKGLFGGHSGVDIHLPRGNAIKIAANILSLCSSTGSQIYLHSWIGGNKRNAIPREVTVKFAIPKNQKQIFIKKIQELIEQTRNYFAQIKPDGMPIEQNLEIQLNEITVERLISGDDSLKLIRFINSLPHGVMQMSAIVADLVETSINLAKIHIEEGFCACDLMARSSIDHELQSLRNRVVDLANLDQWQGKILQAYPGWAPDITQPLFQFVQTHYRKLLSEPIRFGAIHAGLECGLIGRKFPGMQMIAIGPDIKNAHTPDECVNIKSVQIIYSLLQELIKKSNEIQN